LIFQFFSKTEIYRKNEFFACKNRAKWVGGFGKRDIYLRKSEKAKRISRNACLSMLCFISQFFSQAFRKLFAMRKILDFQRFANIKQVFDFQQF